MASSRSIETFVFMDFATEPGTTFPTKVCLRAVPRVLYIHLDTKEPTDILFLDFGRNGFNLDTYHEINNYIKRQTKPVCLVAHYGNGFDFPILKRELQSLKVSLSDDVLCADSLYAFYDILIRSDDDDVQSLVFEGSAVRKIFYEGTNYIKGVSYKLGEIYDRVVETPEVEWHPAKNDTLMLVRISRKLAERFLAWTDQIQRKFADVKPEELDSKFSE